MDFPLEVIVPEAGPSSVRITWDDVILDPRRSGYVGCLVLQRWGDRIASIPPPSRGDFRPDCRHGVGFSYLLAGVVAAGVNAASPGWALWVLALALSLTGRLVWRWATRRQAWKRCERYVGTDPYAELTDEVLCDVEILTLSRRSDAVLRQFRATLRRTLEAVVRQLHDVKSQIIHSVSRQRDRAFLPRVVVADVRSLVSAPSAPPAPSSALLSA